MGFFLHHYGVFSTPLWGFYYPLPVSMYPLVEDMSKIYARPLPRVYAIFLFAIEYSAKAQHTTTTATGVHAGEGAGATPGARGPVVVC